MTKIDKVRKLIQVEISYGGKKRQIFDNGMDLFRTKYVASRNEQNICIVRM